MAEPKKRSVNDILHRLRGEQFRHSQNQKASHSHLTGVYRGYQTSLPSGIRDLSLNDIDDNGPREERRGIDPLVAGPAAPKSWISSTPQNPAENRHSTAWRSKALSLSFSHAPFRSETLRTHVAIAPSDQSTPSPVIALTLVCLRLLFRYYSHDEDFAELVACVPPHLRVLVARDAAVFAPLSCTVPVLKALGHPDGELVVAGSRGTSDKASASIRQLLTIVSAHETQPRTSPHTTPLTTELEAEALTWDSPLHDIVSPPPLRTLVLLSTKLSLEDIACLPATLTNLSLIDMEGPVHLQRLPAACTLISFLDISYNKWLEHPTRIEPWSLSKVPWYRWKKLTVLCVRGCLVLPETVASINEGRWDDVQVIFSDTKEQL